MEFFAIARTKMDEQTIHERVTVARMGEYAVMDYDKDKVDEMVLALPTKRDSQTTPS